jgi:spermidine/putrescine transport system substrate-binding protein
MSLRILGWEGTDDPSLIAPFNDKSGIAVELDAHISDFDAAERVLTGAGAWDLVNINSPFVRDVLSSAGLIEQLTSERLRAAAAMPMPPVFQELNRWGLSCAGAPIGVCQRFGPFNLVINTEAISVDAGEDQGFALARELRFAGRYGILDYDDFNVIHIAMAAGLDPFLRMGEPQVEAFRRTAEAWYSRAAMVTSDHHALNRALVRRDIDFQLGGGVYTCSSARLAGYAQVRSVTPRSGPVEGRGGISFVEVNALLATSQKMAEAASFLEYLVQPGTALRACLAGGSVNPVLQMLEPSVLAQFSAAHLDAMQWETLEDDLSRCAQYRVVPDYKRLRSVLRAARSAITRA